MFSIQWCYHLITLFNDVFLWWRHSVMWYPLMTPFNYVIFSGDFFHGSNPLMTSFSNVFLWRLLFSDIFLWWCNSLMCYHLKTPSSDVSLRRRHSVMLQEIGMNTVFNSNKPTQISESVMTNQPRDKDKFVIFFFVF